LDKWKPLQLETSAQFNNPRVTAEMPRPCVEKLRNANPAVPMGCLPSKSLSQTGGLDAQQA
jgi:hypothetical protein